ncbi:MAG: hypothetical protein ACRDMI_17950 [Streptosporangiaceae bacterium]
MIMVGCPVPGARRGAGRGGGRAGDAWDQLMTRLGYPRYAAGGGDSGA